MNYGLTLTGGGARGAYHAGVYRALTELKIPVTAVTGTSIGAVTAALIAAGENRSIRRLWKSLSLELITGRKRLSLNCSTDNVKALLDMIINEDKIRASDMLFGFEVMCPHRLRNRELFIDDIPRGELTDYLTAAVCLPVFKPYIIRGIKYIDGGFLDNAPFDMLVKRGHKNIILSDDHGIGPVRRLRDPEVSLIRIRYKRPKGSILNFNTKVTGRAIMQGYFDTLHELGAVSGEVYAFENEDYYRWAKKYGRESIRRLEKAAKKARIDPLKRYRIGEIACLIRNE